MTYPSNVNPYEVERLLHHMPAVAAKAENDFARGFAASVWLDLRLVLLVSITKTDPVTGLGSTSSGRSIGVAPSMSAARRVSIRTSAWLLKP